jgi:hypothetical protein
MSINPKTTTSQSYQLKTQPQNNGYLWISILIIAIFYFFIYSALNQKILSHNVYDSYMRQAMAWWNGHTYLDQDYTHLELAFFNNRIYVSFPPFPSVIEFFLIPFFKEKLPNNLLTTVYTVMSFVFVYKFIKRKIEQDAIAIFWGIFLIFGSNLLAMSVFGGVWFEAQALNILCTIISLYYITSDKRRHWYWGLLFYAFAVGCRPLMLDYLPLYIAILYKNMSSFDTKPKSWKQTVPGMLKYFIPFAATGLVYAVYNYVRFHNPVEFGHNYLPEFVQAKDGQFNLRYISQNWKNIFAMPSYVNGRLSFPKFNGFAFYIANPFFIVFIIAIIQNIRRKKSALFTWSIPLLMVLHILLTLSHKTLGGWQFGIRYFVDMLPFAFYYMKQSDPKLTVHRYDMCIMFFAVLINLYGTLWFYLDWK